MMEMLRPKKSFVQAIEVWVPNEDRTRLKLHRGSYGNLAEVANESHGMEFEKGQGLPGRAWAEEHPVIFKDLQVDEFLRRDVARQSGLTCGVAIPIFRGDELTSVFVILAAEDADHIGAIEIWHAPAGESELSFVDGHFGTATKFEFQARHVRFSKGFGLPGLVWQERMPVAMADLGRTKRFFRRDSAQEAGITRGLGLPVGRIDRDTYVLNILSALSTPIVRRFEIWVPGEDGLTFQSGVCESDADLASQYADTRITSGDNPIFEAYKQQIPNIASQEACVPADPLL